MTGQTLSQVCVQAMTIGLDVLAIEDAAARPVDATDVTDVVNRISAALGRTPLYERRGAGDRRRTHDHYLPAICSCCCASIRPEGPRDIAIYRSTPRAGGRERICSDCLDCPPEYRHPVNTPMPGTAEEAYRAATEVPLICACCAGSIRPAPNDPRYLRQHADGRREPLCQTCVAECPPGYVHPPEPDLGDPAAVEEAVREEVWATQHRPPLSAAQLLREVTERNEP